MLYFNSNLGATLVPVYIRSIPWQATGGATRYSISHDEKTYSSINPYLLGLARGRTVRVTGSARD